MPTKVKMVCPYCEGENIKVDAWAEWNVEAQQWELAETFDAAYCEDCDGEIKYAEAVELDA